MIPKVDAKCPGDEDVRGRQECLLDEALEETFPASDPISPMRLDGAHPMKTHSTRIDLTANAKSTSIDLLNARLADAIDLALLTKQAHWNLKGPRFIAVHEMLDGFRQEIDTHVDVMAERVAQLGGTALGTSQVVASKTSLPAYPTDIYTVQDHLEALADHYGKAANSVRRAIDQADEAGDANTADIFTAFSRELDKSLWFIEAHLQEGEAS
jgi:starvation-inducible DNA-binding protein